MVDWVLRMARVPADDFLDAVAARGGLTPALLDALADAVAAYHQALPPVRGRAAADAADRAGQRARRRWAPACRRPTWRHGGDAMLAALDCAGPAARRSARGAGFVRRAHGDLHLGNLCLWQGRPVPFDALEFDETLATIDLAYDLAFLLMDLDQRVDRAAANRVLNRYVARTGDVGLVRDAARLPVDPRHGARACRGAQRSRRRHGGLSSGRARLSAAGARRWWSRSAGCRAAASPRWRARWHPDWAARQAR